MLKKYKIYGEIKSLVFLGNCEAETSEKAIEKIKDDPEIEGAMNLWNFFGDELKIKDFDEIKAEEIEQVLDFSIGYLKDNVSDWNDFCSEVGLNPWVLNEGLANRDDIYTVKVSVLKKYGILK